MMDPRQRIVQRIKKLLAIASGSTSTGEVENAMLKAQQLLVEHRLNPQEIHGNKAIEVLENSVFSAKRTPSWIMMLHSEMGQNFRCHSIWRRDRVLGMSSLIFLGKAEDVEISTAVFEYAVQEGKRLCESEHASLKSKNSFYLGYASGVAIALKKQREEKSDEWGLVLLPDPDVEQYVASKKMPTYRAKKNTSLSMDSFTRGYREGLSFTPNAISE